MATKPAARRPIRAAAEHGRRKQVDENHQERAEHRAGQPPGERVAAGIEADQRAVPGAQDEAPMVVCLAIGADVERHCQRRRRKRRLVEGGEAGARVVPAVDVRLDRPDDRLASRRDAGHVDDVGDRLVADQRWCARQRHDVGEDLRVAVDGCQPARRRRVLVIGRETTGQSQQLLVVPAATRDERADQRLVDRDDAQLIALGAQGRLERGAVQEDDRVARRIGRRHEVRILVGAAHPGDAAVGAVARRQHLVGQSVDDGDAVRPAEQDDALVARQLDLADAGQVGLDRRTGGRCAAVG